MALSESAAKAIQQTKAIHQNLIKEIEEKEARLLQEKELLEAIREARTFAFEKPQGTLSKVEFWRLFAREWGEKILHAAHLLRSYAPNLKIKKMPLPKGPVPIVAKDIFLNALNPNCEPTEFFEDLYKACADLESPEKLHWVLGLPQGTTLIALRDFFGVLEGYVREKVFGELKKAETHGEDFSSVAPSAELIEKIRSRINPHSSRMGHRGLLALLSSPDRFLTASDFKSKGITMAQDEEEAVRSVYQAIQKDFLSVMPHILFRKGNQKRDLVPALQFIAVPKSRKNKR